MENQIVLRAYNSKRQTPVRLSPLEDKTGKLFTGQGKFGYFDLLTEEEKRSLPMIITRETVITIDNGTIINLNDPIDAANWKWMQLHAYITLDKEKGQSSRDVVFYVDNPERDAEIHLTKDKRITMAKAKIYAVSHNKKIQLAQALGNPGATALSTNILEEWLIVKAEITPDSITKLLDTKANLRLNGMIVFEDLKRYRLIKKHAGSWRFGGNDGLSLGTDDESVVDFIINKDNDEQVFAMMEQLKEKKGEK